MPSKARQGLDLLLERYPNALHARIASQDQFAIAMEPGPWTIADLVDEGRLLRFAIWNRTGHVYRVDAFGAVEDDPFIMVKEEHMPPATDNVPEPLRGHINAMEERVLAAKSQLYTEGADPETTWLRLVVGLRDEMVALYESVVPEPDQARTPEE